MVWAWGLGPLVLGSGFSVFGGGHMTLGLRFEVEGFGVFSVLGLQIRIWNVLRVKVGA